MSIYLSVFAALALLGLARLSGKQARLWQVVLYLFLVVFVGTRVNVGCDFIAYFWRYQYLIPDFSALTSETEPGYFLFSALIKRMGLPFMWLNVAGAALFFFFLLRFARNHPRPLLVIALMFPLLVVQLSMSGLRQALAVAFLMGALDAFMKGRRTQVVLFILLGSSFHQSLVILLPLALMVGRSFSLLRVLGAIAVLMPVAVYLLSNRMELYQDRYLEEVFGEMSSAGAIFRLGIIVLTAVGFELYHKRMARVFPREYNLMRVFSLVSFALIPVMLVNTVAVHRLIFYVVPMQAYMLAGLPAALFTNRRAIALAELVPVAAYTCYLLVWFTLSRHASVCYVPYQSYLLP